MASTPSLVFAFTLTQLTGTSSSSAMRLRIARRYGASRGCSAHTVTSRLLTVQPSLAHQCRDVPHQLAAGDAAKALVGVRKMLADITDPHGAEDGVADGVQHDIAVRVPEQAARAVDADAAQHERAPLDEAVQVVAVADAHHEKT